ncbi:hypothetical protein Q4567_00265 [Aliiglaciecola sp. 2_MG-2023]|uniref:hypothetical protein n=1 Tax=unclassified Aliiglaciecola TaxID=2593648 RepID=UPI0026E45D77|nr:MULTISPECIES: hypothetical protein [unclassified Aliiglaciecola]MDO6709141.1 hypothetical protein [Aliiglaciecola sp. 2_MG-2023]MDO6750289.1 hypothetical protein [Aliiglaciecola sp. 1_MG-2023]
MSQYQDVELIKNVYIHVGPPKTGTSAVQKWLNSNQDFLKENGIFYPSHNVDSNGVSSGNVRSIYDINANKQLSLNTDNLSKLLDGFYKSDFTTLLLSSEFFFRRMEELKRAIPDANFIAYIRNPMEIKESTYNQSVKRHFQVQTINVDRSKRLPYMDRFVEFITQFKADDLYLRVYGDKYFKNGNIVSDLLSVLGVDVRATLPMVNSSYQFEALEFKRWFNQFELHDYQVLVDRALQGYTGGTSHYSLIQSTKYVEDSIYYSSIIDGFARDLNASCLQVLVADMKSPDPKPFFEQGLNETDFLSVCDYLQNILKVDYYLLTKKIESSKVSEDKNYRLLFVNSCASKYKYMHRFYQFRFRIKKAINSLKSKIK